MQFSKYLEYSSPHVDLPGQDAVSGFLITTDNVEILVLITDTLSQTTLPVNAASVPSSLSTISSSDRSPHTDVCCPTLTLSVRSSEGECQLKWLNSECSTARAANNVFVC